MKNASWKEIFACEKAFSSYPELSMCNLKQKGIIGFRLPNEYLALGEHIKRQLLTKGRGNLNQFIVDAYIEKWERQSDKEKKAKRRKPSVHPSLADDTVPELFEDYINQMIECKEAINETDALRLIVIRSKLGELATLFLMRQLEEIIVEVDAAKQSSRNRHAFMQNWHLDRDEMQKAIFLVSDL